MGTTSTRNVLGVDVGGTRLRLAVCGPEGEVLAVRTTMTEGSGGPNAVVAQIVTLFEEIDFGLRSTLHGVGIGIPGPVDTAQGIVHVAPALSGWVDVPIAALLRAHIDLPCLVENDARSAAMAEWRYGAGRGTRDMAYVTVSTGIGGGVIVDGRLLHGRERLAGSFGHMIVADDSPVCYCGNKGCWEAVASGSAMGWIASREASSGRFPASSLAGKGTLTAADVFDAAQAGDELAVMLMDREAEYLARGFVNLLHLFAPDRIVVGGGVGRRLDFMGSAVRREVSERALPPYRGTPIMASELDDLAGVMGAACLIRDELERLR